MDVGFETPTINKIEEKCRKKGKKCRNVLQVSKKDVTLHPQFGGMAFMAASKGQPNLLKNIIWRGGGIGRRATLRW